MKTEIRFEVEFEWLPDGLIIWVPNAAAQAFMTRAITDEPIIITVKDGRK